MAILLYTLPLCCPAEPLAVCPWKMIRSPLSWPDGASVILVILNRNEAPLCLSTWLSSVLREPSHG